jgi:flagellar biosynthesis anti-sigma factor FlgM
MKVNDPNLASLASTGATKAQESAAPGARPANQPGHTPAVGDDVHLSELVRSLRSLAAESPERQARIEQIARAYASGSYQADTQATASKVIDDALEN